MISIAYQFIFVNFHSTANRQPDRPDINRYCFTYGYFLFLRFWDFVANKNRFQDVRLTTNLPHPKNGFYVIGPI